LAFLPFVVLRAATFAEADTFWEIRTGLITLHDHRIPTHDSFSWTVHGQPWTLNSWGFNVLVALAYRAVGLPGVALACSVLLATIGAVVLQLARSRGASPMVSGALLWAAAVALAGYLSARPQLVDYLCVLVLLILLRCIVEGPNPARSVVAVTALMIVWVNLHTGALLGVGIIAASAVVMCLRPTTRPRAGWGCAAVVAALGGSLANPYGAGVFAQSSQVMHASQGLVSEWYHLDPTNPLQLAPFAAGVIALALAARSRDVVSTAALAVTAPAAVTAIRFLPVLLLIALPVLARSASQLSVPRSLRSRRMMLARGGTMAAAAGATAMLVLAVPAARHLGRPDPATYPSSAAQAIPPGCNVFTSDLLGGFLILKRPDVLVSLDSRNDLYGRERDNAALKVLDGQGDLRAALAGADCVLVPPASGLAIHLASSAQWQERSRESSAVLFVRR
jgi:hypothetical protein